MSDLPPRLGRRMVGRLGHVQNPSYEAAMSLMASSHWAITARGNRMRSRLRSPRTWERCLAFPSLDVGKLVQKNTEP